jgi:hypothetical protein
MAEVLDHSDDEIIFVDCNTPDDMPTFPEAIQDILTPKAKNLIRILRLRPEMYVKHKHGSPLKALEPLSRNIALRRSNPSNKWMLSSNTDMVFVMRDSAESVSDVAGELEDGFYELPRFEIPEPLWESVDRMDPQGVLSSFRRWGERLHLNEVIHARPEILFDGPGDFQLMMREQVFSIHGFHEKMIYGWHLDSNICRRLYLLNGETKSLLERVFAYHCDHTLQATFMHGPQRTENDWILFSDKVFTPFLPEQADTWGLPNEDIEELSLAGNRNAYFPQVLEDVLPEPSGAMTSDFYCNESYDHGQIYDTVHAVPFVLAHLSTLHRGAKIGYQGGNVHLLEYVDKALSGLGHDGRILVSEELLHAAHPHGASLPPRCEIRKAAEVNAHSDIHLFDVAMMHLPQTVNDKGISFPETSDEYYAYKTKLKNAFLVSVKQEQSRVRSGDGQPRKYLLIGSQGTWLEAYATGHISFTLTPYGSHVRHGYIRIVSPAKFFLRHIISAGLLNKERIKKMPVVGRIAKPIYRKLLSKI